MEAAVCRLPFQLIPSLFFLLSFLRQPASQKTSAEVACAAGR
jgi:hypothetical protein